MAAPTYGTGVEADHNIPAKLEGSVFPTNFAGLFRTAHGLMLGWGDTVPADADTGWGKAALFLHTDGSGGDTLVYQNNGSTTSAAFIEITSIAGADFEATGILSDVVAESTSAAGVTVDGVIIKDGAITTTTTANVMAGGDKTLMIATPDTAYTVLAVNSGKVHYVPNLSADRVYTLPANEAGLYYEFWSTLIAADGHDLQIVADNAADFYEGCLMWTDSDLTVGAVISAPDGTSDHTLNILLPANFCIKMYCDGTNWFITGTVFASGTPTWT